MNLGRILLPDILYEISRKYLGRNFNPPWLKTDRLLEAGVSLKEHRVAPKNDARGLRVIEALAKSLHGRGLPALLRHADRNSMHFSLESRVPFLTIPFAELFLSLPEQYLISPSGETKSVFRAAMRGIVPDDVLDRKDKIGFQTPENTWLRGMEPTIRQWLQASGQIPFVNRDILLKSFDEVLAGRIPFRQAWRWINYVRWYQHMNIKV